MGMHKMDDRYYFCRVSLCIMIVPREFELELRLRPVMDIRNGVAAKNKKRLCTAHISLYNHYFSSP